MAGPDSDGRFAAHLQFIAPGEPGQASRETRLEVTGGSPPLPPELGRAEARLEVFESGMVLSELRTDGAAADMELRIALLPRMYKLTFHLHDDPQTAGIEGVPGEIVLRRGDTFVLSPEAAGTRLFRKGMGSHDVCVFVPEALAEGLMAENTAALDAGDAGRVLHRGCMTPALGLAVGQYANCRYSGTLRSFYLEAKAREIAALRFSGILPAGGCREYPRPLSRADRERILEARRILEAEMRSPPSLAELARRLGIGRTKLKEEFRREFGTSIFHHLHDIRMQYALRLLRDGDCNVGETAAAAGYSELSAFCAAFHRTFGFPPGEARKRGEGI